MIQLSGFPSSPKNMCHAQTPSLMREALCLIGYLLEVTKAASWCLNMPKLLNPHTCASQSLSVEIKHYMPN